MSRLRSFAVLPVACLVAAAAWMLSDCSPGRRQVVRAYYFWKSRFALTDSDRVFLGQAGIERLYLHFFDIVWDEADRSAVPVAMVDVASRPDSAIEIVPVVYIAHDVLRRMNPRSIPDLARNIHRQIVHIARSSGLSFREIQIDCDWTLRTRDMFFALLKQLRTTMPRHATLSATIRLHQLVHADRTGIPPVDRGMLMFYNMGKKSPDEREHSIFSSQSAAAYLDQYRTYAMPLDVALPHFGWVLHFRDGSLVDILQSLREHDVRTAHMFTRVASNLYRADGSFVFRGSYVMKGDLLKVEVVDSRQCAEAARMLAAAIGRDSRAVALFSYDSSTPSSREPHAIESIFRNF